jgi:hypothetical protein
MHLSAVAGPCAAATEAATAARQRTRAAHPHIGEADDGNDDQRF